MENWLLLLFTLAIGTAGGVLLFKLKVPAGMIMGSMVAVAVANILTTKIYLPSAMRTMAQILAGGYIASTVTKDDLRRFPHLVKPYLLVMVSYLLLNLICGVIIRQITPNISLLTALFCCVPGGMTDIPIIAVEMGADVTKVAAMQFVRLVIGFAVLPSLISVFTKRNPVEKAQEPSHKKALGSAQDLLITLVIAAAAGVLGKMIGIPAGTILFAIIGVIAYKLLGGRTYIPVWIRRIAQLLTGMYIGTYFTRQNVSELMTMWPAALVLIAGFSLNCFVMGIVNSRLTRLTRAEAMLSSTPAGASDMALISADLGITNPEVSVIHVLRLIGVVLFFPHIISLFAQLFGELL